LRSDLIEGAGSARVSDSPDHPESHTREPTTAVSWTIDSGVMSLRGRTIEHSAKLPDGRNVVVHVGVPEDPYIPRSQLETVDVELHSGGHVLAAVNTVLDVDQESEAEQLAREIAQKLESGEIEPTAHAIEPLADTLR
jgi:hypothetical protein